MEPILISEGDLAAERADEGQLVHAWRAEQLRRLGFPQALADMFAAHIDWHEVAELTARGCPPELALEIVR
jgi:hypothetical protein